MALQLRTYGDYKKNKSWVDQYYIKIPDLSKYIICPKCKQKCTRMKVNTLGRRDAYECNKCRVEAHVYFNDICGDITIIWYLRRNGRRSRLDF